MCLYVKQQWQPLIDKISYSQDIVQLHEYRTTRSLIVLYMEHYIYVIENPHWPRNSKTKQAMNFACILEETTRVYFLLLQDVTLLTIIKMHPEVDFLSAGHHQDLGSCTLWSPCCQLFYIQGYTLFSFTSPHDLLSIYQEVILRVWQVSTKNASYKGYIKPNAYLSIHEVSKTLLKGLSFISAHSISLLGH